MNVIRLYGSDRETMNRGIKHRISDKSLKLEFHDTISIEHFSLAWGNMDLFFRGSKFHSFENELFIGVEHVGSYIEEENDNND